MGDAQLATEGLVTEDFDKLWTVQVKGPKGTPRPDLSDMALVTTTGNTQANLVLRANALRASGDILTLP